MMLRGFVLVFLLFPFLLFGAYAFTASNQFGIGRVEASPNGWNWYKAELHHHSGFSDGMFCLGAVTTRAKELGYNAFFLADHDGYHLRTLTFDDSLEGFGRSEVLDTGAIWHEKVDQLVTTPIKKGTHSLHYRLNASGGRGWVNYEGYQGPVLYAGNLFVNFSVYPTEFSGSLAGAYIGLWFGGLDIGITLANGTWVRQYVNMFFGLSNALYGNHTTADTVNRAFLLPYTLNAWNSYSINITDYMVKTLPDMLAPHVSMRRLYIGAVSNGGQLAEVYFDDVALYAQQPKSAGELFAYRNEALLEFNTDTFKSFPSVEFSGFKHFNYFKYDFQSAEDYFTTRQIAKDHKGVVDYAHGQGYPIVINHPNSTDLIDYIEGGAGVIANNAFGADLIEIASLYQKQPATEVWDALLKKGLIIIGVWASDRHNFLRSGDPATIIYSPDLTLESLLKSLFEGRAFMTRNNFTGRLIYNIKPSLEPYPARYTNYVSLKDNATLYLKIDQGLQNGWKLAWIRNGTYFLNETITSTSLEVTKSFNLPDNANYFRVEIRDETDAIVAMSQAIFFKKVSNMPIGTYVYLDDVTTPNGKNYHNQGIKGITSIIYAIQRLTATAYIPEGATTIIKIYSPLGAPHQVFIDGKQAPFTHVTNITTVSFTGSRQTEVNIYYAQPKIVGLTFRKLSYGTNETVDLSLTIYGNYTTPETIRWLARLTINDQTGTVVKKVDREFQLSKGETTDLNYTIEHLKKGTYTVEAVIIDLQNPKNILATTHHTFEVTEVPIAPSQSELTWYILILTTLIIGVTIFYCIKKRRKRGG